MGKKNKGKKNPMYNKEEARASFEKAISMAQEMELVMLECQAIRDYKALILDGEDRTDEGEKMLAEAMKKSTGDVAALKEFLYTPRLGNAAAPLKPEWAPEEDD
jgi:hypothetical protein